MYYCRNIVYYKSFYALNVKQFCAFENKLSGNMIFVYIFLDSLYFGILTTFFFVWPLSNINCQKSINLILETNYKINVNYVIEHIHVATNIMYKIFYCTKITLFWFQCFSKSWHLKMNLVSDILLYWHHWVLLKKLSVHMSYIVN